MVCDYHDVHTLRIYIYGSPNHIYICKAGRIHTYIYVCIYNWCFLSGSVEAACNAETWQELLVLPLGQEDHLEKEIAPHSSILSWKIPWIEKPGRLQSMGSQKGQM